MPFIGDSSPGHQEQHPNCPRWRTGHVLLTICRVHGQLSGGWRRPRRSACPRRVAMKEECPSTWRFDLSSALTSRAPPPDNSTVPAQRTGRSTEARGRSVAIEDRPAPAAVSRHRPSAQLEVHRLAPAEAANRRSTLTDTSSTSRSARLPRIALARYRPTMPWHPDNGRSGVIAAFRSLGRTGFAANHTEVRGHATERNRAIRGTSDDPGRPPS